jgi:CRP/FNR family transcriptional regulator, cyclic AMP receptor protein
MTESMPPASVDGSTIDLLATDRELAEGVPDEDRPAAQRALRVPGLTARRGEAVAPEAAGASAMLLVEGALWREIVVGRSVAPQVLHPGAVLLSDPPGRELLETMTKASALTGSRLALLDERFLLAAARWPGLANVLQRRLAEQERDLAVSVAIGAMPRVDDRLLLLLWHFAEHWGSVVPGGVRISLNLTHATLGRFVGARRPTVSLAVSELRERDELDRDPGGAWILTGTPPSVGTGAVPAGTSAGLPDLFPQARARDAA